MAISLIGVLGIPLLISGVTGISSSYIVSIYSTKPYSERLGLALFLSTALTICFSIIALGLIFHDPFLLLNPSGPLILICAILTSFTFIKEDGPVENLAKQ